MNEWFAYLAVCGYQQKSGTVAQAEFYMRELERRESATIANRDFGMAKLSHKMEVWVIILIGFEIVLSLFGIWYNWHENNRQQQNFTEQQKLQKDQFDKQQTVLSNMLTNSTDTATLLGELKDSINTLNATSAASRDIAQEGFYELQKKENLSLLSDDDFRRVATSFVDVMDKRWANYMLEGTVIDNREGFGKPKTPSEKKAFLRERQRLYSKFVKRNLPMQKQATLLIDEARRRFGPSGELLERLKGAAGTLAMTLSASPEKE